MLKKYPLLLLLFIAMSSCNSNPSKLLPKNEQYSLVLLSNYGKIQKSSDGSYQLILDHQNVEHVVAFANRPYRVVKHTTAEQLATYWGEGANSFAADPPNATVVINQHLQVVVIQTIKVVGNKTLFTIKADGPQSLYALAGPTQVFIDYGINSCCNDNVTNCCDGGYTNY